jgi:hypothetical protein
MFRGAYPRPLKAFKITFKIIPLSQRGQFEVSLPPNLNNKIMVAVVGTYQNGYVKLDKEYPTGNPVKVIVTFLEDIQSPSEKGFSLSDFSFSKSQKNLETYKGSFSDVVIEERISEL